MPFSKLFVLRFEELSFDSYIRYWTIITACLLSHLLPLKGIWMMNTRQRGTATPRLKAQKETEKEFSRLTSNWRGIIGAEGQWTSASDLYLRRTETTLLLLHSLAFPLLVGQSSEDFQSYPVVIDISYFRFYKATPLGLGSRLVASLRVESLHFLSLDRWLGWAQLQLSAISR